MAYGLQLMDAAGNIVLDTTTLTVKDASVYSNPSITATGTISVGTTNIPAATEVVVYNNAGEGDLATGVPQIILDKTAGRLSVSGGGGSFNVGVRLLQLD